MPQACATATAGAAFVPQSNWSFSPELQNDSSVFCSVADSDAFHATTALATASAAEEESLAVEHSASTYHVASNSPSAESIRETSFSDLCVLPSPISLSIPALTAEVTTRPRRASAARARTMMSEAVGGSCIVAADEDLENEDTDEADGEHDDDDSDVDMSGRKKKRRASGSSASSKRKRSRRSATADAPSSSREGKKPRQNFTKEARTLLKQWLAVHMSHPYPTEDEKEALAEECNLSMEQLGNWYCLCIESARFNCFVTGVFFITNPVLMLRLCWVSRAGL